MSSTRPAPVVGGTRDRPGTGQGAERMKRHVSDEARQKLSELAKQRHAAGEFGKPRDGRKPRSKRKPSKARVAQMVAEAALERKNASMIIEVFKDGIHPNQPMTIRLKAAEAWLGVEREESKLTLKEQVTEDEKMDREQLLETLSKSLTSGHSAQLVRKQLEAQSEIIDAEIVE